jgi:hypothetical protein
MAVISFLMRNGHSNLHVDGIEMLRQSTGTRDAEMSLPPLTIRLSSSRFSVYFRLLYHCFLFVVRSPGLDFLAFAVPAKGRVRLKICSNEARKTSDVLEYFQPSVKSVIPCWM